LNAFKDQGFVVHGATPPLWVATGVDGAADMPP
jgi:hypothetical protein